ncbi:transcription elongation factor B polypeptide 3-like [Pollicipes pollicipes]|uniref:transcription elongation factor B polypeptide 3-like n=1 Tax=Pollicipes pollicipes TaxID=41117 RepID=UPI0018857B93|nr:transcription elongation factor B polypeptide 3-like [Pollicipes pollicipes]
MTMSASLLEIVEHYQKKVERYSDEDKILHCFSKLQRLPITVDVLSRTGVGKTVNAFRRDPGPVGLKSRELVSKWKRIFDENEQAERASARSASPAASDGSERMEIDEVNGEAARKERHHGSKHKSSRRDRDRSEQGAAARPAPALREVDFLGQPSSGGGDEETGGASFAAALGGSDSVVRKKKKKSKSSSSKSSSSLNSSGSLVERARPSPPPPPPALEVLDALPEISGHYRPLPRAPAAGRPAAKRTLDEEEALAAVLGAKNKRTKVYSGARSAGWSRVPTLVDICLRSLQENIDYLEYTGGVPYDILRPVLEKCSAGQLHNIEYYNSYLLEDTDALWKALVHKEFRAEPRQEMETWREMHIRCAEEREIKYNKLRSIIEGKRQESLASSRKTKVAYEHTVAKPPRNVARKQAKNGTAVAVAMPMPNSMAAGGARQPRPAPGADPTSRPAAPGRTAAPQKKKAPLMAKVLRAMGRR